MTGRGSSSLSGTLWEAHNYTCKPFTPSGIAQKHTHKPSDSGHNLHPYANQNGLKRRNDAGSRQIVRGVIMFVGLTRSTS